MSCPECGSRYLPEGYGVCPECDHFTPKPASAARDRIPQTPVGAPPPIPAQSRPGKSRFFKILVVIAMALLLAAILFSLAAMD